MYMLLKAVSGLYTERLTVIAIVATFVCTLNCLYCIGIIHVLITITKLIKMDTLVIITARLIEFNDNLVGLRLEILFHLTNNLVYNLHAHKMRVVFSIHFSTQHYLLVPVFVYPQLKSMTSSFSNNKNPKL